MLISVYGGVSSERIRSMMLNTYTDYDYGNNFFGFKMLFGDARGMIISARNDRTDEAKHYRPT